MDALEAALLKEVSLCACLCVTACELSARDVRAPAAGV